MAHNKKKTKKHRTLYKAIKPYIKDNRILYSILAGMSAGVVLGLVMGTEKSRDLLYKVKASLMELGLHETKKDKKPKPVKQLKTDKPVKPKKPKKLFSKDDLQEKLPT